MTDVTTIGLHSGAIFDVAAEYVHVAERLQFGGIASYLLADGGVGNVTIRVSEIAWCTPKAEVAS